MIIKVCDLETTGFAPPEGSVCEIGFASLVSTGIDLAGGPINWIVAARQHSWLVDPGKAIPPEVSAVTHLINEDVTGYPTFEELCKEIFAPAANPPETTFLAAHSAKFEQLWLTPEITGLLQWICSYKAALRLWADAPSHSNQALRYWRRPAGLDRAIATPAHRAFPDAYVTAHLLRDMLNDGATTEQLVKWSSEPALQVRCHIGKWRGKPWREVDDGFLTWVSERDFDEDVLFTVKTEIARRDAEWRAEHPQTEPAIDDEAPF